MTVSDGRGGTATATVTVTVTPVNDLPTVQTSPGSAAFTEGGAPAVVDPAVAVSDVDDTTLTGATVSITAGRSADDQLLFTNQAGISGSYSAATGVLTLSGSASVAAYQAALRSVAFRITGANPLGGPRTVAFRASDAGGAGAAATRTVAVTTVNDAPVLTSSSPTLAYTENDAPTAIDGTVAISDPDSPTMAGATVAIAGCLTPAEDRLRFTAQNGITATYTAATGVLSLTGTATVAEYQAALRSVAYENLSDNPSVAGRTIAYSVNDGGLTSNLVNASVSVTPVNDAPKVTTSTGTANYSENGSAATVDSGLVLDDVDSANLTGATVAFSAGRDASNDTLAATAQFGITVTPGAGGSLVLAGTATLAQYQTVLRSVTFLTAGDDPSTATRTIAFTVTDSSSATSAPGTRDVSVTPVNDAPSTGGVAGTVTFSEDGPAVAIFPTLTTADPDNANFAGRDGHARRRPGGRRAQLHRPVRHHRQLERRHGRADAHRLGDARGLSGRTPHGHLLDAEPEPVDGDRTASVVVFGRRAVEPVGQRHDRRRGGQRRAGRHRGQRLGGLHRGRRGCGGRQRSDAQ